MLSLFASCRGARILLPINLKGRPLPSKFQNEANLCIQIRSLGSVNILIAHALNKFQACESYQNLPRQIHEAFRLGLHNEWIDWCGAVILQQ
jgi:hypothetical protein